MFHCMSKPVLFDNFSRILFLFIHLIRDFKVKTDAGIVQIQAGQLLDAVQPVEQSAAVDVQRLCSLYNVSLQPQVSLKRLVQFRVVLFVVVCELLDGLRAEILIRDIFTDFIKHVIQYIILKIITPDHAVAPAAVFKRDGRLAVPPGESVRSQRFHC